MAHDIVTDPPSIAMHPKHNPKNVNITNSRISFFFCFCFFRLPNSLILHFHYYCSETHSNYIAVLLNPSSRQTNWSSTMVTFSKSQINLHMWQSTIRNSRQQHSSMLTKSSHLVRESLRRNLPTSFHHTQRHRNCHDHHRKLGSRRLSVYPFLSPTQPSPPVFQGPLRLQRIPNSYCVASLLTSDASNIVSSLRPAVKNHRAQKKVIY